MNKLSVVIPSYNRAQELLDTLDYLFNQSRQADEIIVVDQTVYLPDDPAYARLHAHHKQGQIHWVRRSKPSIPTAMNVGLSHATSKHVLFLDDDIVIDAQFIQAHVDTLKDHSSAAHVGQVLQPGESPMHTGHQASHQPLDDLTKDLAFAFNSSEPAHVHNCMAGNLCVDRQAAIDAGGFDENFIGAAYRFETEFCRRVIRLTGKPFYFSPRPILNHLQAGSGGTRSVTNYLTSAAPYHSVGDYYFALTEARGFACWVYIGRRFVRSLCAKFYLSKPWYLPHRLVGELRGLSLAIKLYLSGPALLANEVAEQS